VRRHELRDDQWTQIAPLIPKNNGRPSKNGDRAFIDAVIWLAKTGAPWRDLHPRFVPWKTIFNRFNNWSRRGAWGSIFKALQIDIDPNGSMAEGSVIRAHQHAAGGKGGSDAMLWGGLEEVFRRKSMRSSIPRESRSTSKSRPVKHTKLPLPKR
jgi:transposase